MNYLDCNSKDIETRYKKIKNSVYPYQKVTLLLSAEEWKELILKCRSRGMTISNYMRYVLRGDGLDAKEKKRGGYQGRKGER